MVYAFIIHTLLPPVPKILYSCMFGSETICDIGEDSGVGIRSASKEQIVEVALEIQSQYNFRTSVSGRSYEANMQALQNEGTLPELELGFVRFPCGGRQSGGDGKSYGRVKSAVWLGALNCAFVLLCDAHENRALAEHALKVLVKHLHEHCRVFHQPADVSGKMDRVALVLNQFLPGGQLLVMNHRTASAVREGVGREN